MVPSQQGIRGSTVYFVLTLIVLAAAAAYGVMQFMLMRAEKIAIADSELQISALGLEVKEATEKFKKFAEARAEKARAFNKSVSSILPVDENYTDLTRLFDNFFAENDTAQNPIVQSSLRFGKGTAVAGISNVSALPVSMNIEGTRDNFFKFLEFVERSGSLDSGLRLMAINSIQLNFPEGGEIVDNAKQVMNFTVDMTAYYQTPRTRR